MKITARPSFVADIELPIEAVQVLMKLSALHYDATCREAATPCGFLSVWKRTIEDAKQFGYTPEITATSRQLNLSLKIMEMALPGAVTHEEMVYVSRVRSLFSRVFHRLNDLYTKSVCEFREPF